MSGYKKNILTRRPQTFMRGVSVLGSGLKYSLNNKRILTLALIPVVITILFVSLGFEPLFKFYVSYATGSLINESSFGSSSFTIPYDIFGLSSFIGPVLLWMSKFAIKALSGFLSFLTFYIVLQVVYIPICALLAEAVLANRGIVQLASMGASLRFNLGMLRAGLVKSLALIIGGIFCFLFSFIPFLNFLPVYFTLLVLAYDSFDYGLELYGFSFKERIAFVRKEFLLVNGHSGVLFFFSFIPGLLLLTLPFSVIGASLLIGESNEFKREIT